MQVLELPARAVGVAREERRARRLEMQREGDSYTVSHASAGSIATPASKWVPAVACAAAAIALRPARRHGSANGIRSDGAMSERP